MKNLLEKCDRYEKSMSSLESEKRAAVTDFETVKKQLHEANKLTKQTDQEISNQNDTLIIQVGRLERHIAELQKEKQHLDEQLSSVRADLERARQLLHENNKGDIDKEKINSKYLYHFCIGNCWYCISFSSFTDTHLPGF